MKSDGANGSPCRSPRDDLNKPVREPFSKTENQQLDNSKPIMDINLIENPNLRRTHKIPLHTIIGLGHVQLEDNILSRPYIQRLWVLFSNTRRCEESIQQEESELLPLVTSLLWEQREQNPKKTFRCHLLSFLTKEIPFRLPLLVRFYKKRISLCHSILPIFLLQMPKQRLIQSNAPTLGHEWRVPVLWVSCLLYSSILYAAFYCPCPIQSR